MNRESKKNLMAALSLTWQKFWSLEHPERLGIDIEKASPLKTSFYAAVSEAIRDAEKRRLFQAARIAYDAGATELGNKIQKLVEGI